jgi:hypothetical protein
MASQEVCHSGSSSIESSIDHSQVFSTFFMKVIVPPFASVVKDFLKKIPQITLDKRCNVAYHTAMPSKQQLKKENDDLRKQIESLIQRNNSLEGNKADYEPRMPAYNPPQYPVDPIEYRQYRRLNGEYVEYPQFTDPPRLYLTVDGMQMDQAAYDDYMEARNREQERIDRDRQYNYRYYVDDQFANTANPIPPAYPLANQATATAAQATTQGAVTEREANAERWVPNWFRTTTLGRWGR